MSRPLYTYRRGRYVCAVCGKEVRDNSLAKASHARKHVREGTANEEERDGFYRNQFTVTERVAP